MKKQILPIRNKTQLFFRLSGALSLIGRMISQLCLASIRLYQFTLSPFLGNCCRFYPSCSAYALQAIQQHGPLRGGWLIIKRLSKCHPWHPGGVDEVRDSDNKPLP